MHVYQAGRFDIHYVEVEDALSPRSSWELMAPRRHEMVLLCAVNTTTEAWRFAEAVAAAKTEPVIDVLSGVDEMRTLRLLFKPFVR